MRWHGEIIFRKQKSFIERLLSAMLCIAYITSHPSDRWHYPIIPVLQMRNLRMRNKVNYPRDKESSRRGRPPQLPRGIVSQSFSELKGVWHQAMILCPGWVLEEKEVRTSRHTTQSCEAWGGVLPSHPCSPPTWKRTSLLLPQAWASCQRWALIKALGLLLEFLCSRTHPIRRRSHIFGPF